MWQRIQTLFLALAAALTLSLFWVDIARILGPDGAVEYVGFCEKPLYLYLVLAALASVLAALFTFKYRMLQLRLCVVSALIFTGVQVLVAVDFFRAPEQMVYLLPAVFPLVCAILDLLAARNVFLDETMVRSAYRLRQASKERRKQRRRESRR